MVGAMPSLQVGMSTTDLLRIAAKFGLSAGELNKAAARAINDVAKTGRGRTRKRVRAHVTLPASRVNRSIEVVSRATPTNLLAVIGIDHFGRGRTGQARRPTLMSFKGRPSKPDSTRASAIKRRYMSAAAKAKRRTLRRRPFTYQLLKSGPRKELPGGFVQYGQEFAGSRDARATGRAQAFVRRGADRYPLDVPKGPSAAALWQNKSTGIAADVMADLRERLPSRIQGQARRIYDSKWKRVTQ